MNIRTCAEHLLTYFAPEERSIPESVTYPGRHAAIAKALNDAMQELFGKGGAWVKKDERGHVLNAPTTVGIVVTNGSKLATISAADWQDWFAGCTIVIAGSAVDNQIRNDSREVVLKFPHDGASCDLAKTINITGDLVSDGPGGPASVTFPPLDRISDITPPPGFEDATIFAWGDFIQGTETEGQLYSVSIFHHGDTHTATIWHRNSGTNNVWELTDIPADATNPADLDWTGSATTDDTTGDPIITATAETVSATVYQDSVSVDDDVLEVIKPVRLNRKPLAPYAQPYDMPDGARSTEDFGAHMHTDAGIYEVARISDTTGTPVAFAVETWSPSDTESPKIRVRLYPAPKLSAFLEYRCMLLPPVISDITSTSALPVPFGWIQSVFLPIAVKKLRGCSFWRGIVSDDEVNAAYKIALESLSDIKPKQTGGIRLVPRC